MGGSVTRRAVLGGSLSLFFVPDLAAADPSRPYRVALVTSGRTSFVIEWIRKTFETLGYREGKDVVYDLRAANGYYPVLPDLVKELIALEPDVIIAEGTPAVAAAQHATSTIPIVMSPATDPIGSGFVKSFPHPGGNITGVANMFGDLTAKTLDIIRLLFPKARKIGILTSSNPTHPALVDVARQAAAKFGMSAEKFSAPDPDDLERAFAEMKAAGCDVVYVLADPVRLNLPPIALKSGLPAVYQIDTYVRNGGLASYGPEINTLFVLAAQIADRILKGGNPADIPVEQPTKFDFVINMRTAKALGLFIPESVLLMADKVIE